MHPKSTPILAAACTQHCPGQSAAPQQACHSPSLLQQPSTPAAARFDKNPAASGRRRHAALPCGCPQALDAVRRCSLQWASATWSECRAIVHAPAPARFDVCSTPRHLAAEQQTTGHLLHTRTSSQFPCQYSAPRRWPHSIMRRSSPPVPCFRRGRGRPDGWVCISLEFVRRTA